MIINNLKTLRAQKNWTQSDLAKQVGVTRQTIASIEKGKYSLSLQLAFEIASVFNVSITDCFNFDHEKES
ncbi:helix-turn-helix transcriptional regulator [Facklamia sp. DSM 111018]|uniref:Helix-turn-helix transcriptional regulator n=1 Tax=Facklamia lactis TaxID=2749967 RepID=A0ABS0LRT6_9LACT|nr:helix-turn-helix transcriptional regulator [Facklamia lactis]MBG9980182.1 helix-turn-helix transcriptional regulator [Facklamia lactis]MBG9985984.1 helix-turn-helix transcriptional regulator [Facklamia lactis]